MTSSNINDQASTEPEYGEFEKEKRKLLSQCSKQLKKLLKKKQELQDQLQQCERWKEVQHEGDLLKFHLNTIKKRASSVLVQDWETSETRQITLDPAKTAQEEMKARFRRSKKLHDGIIPLTHYLEQIKKKIHEGEDQQQKLENLATMEELISFKTHLLFSPLKKIEKKVAQKSPESKFYREYLSAAGIKIWVGKNARANEYLTFRLANGRDMWLHALGVSGSHVVIRLPKDQQVDSETLKDAMQLALYYSKARLQGEGEVGFTERKHVSRFGKNKTGKVHVSKLQTAWVRLDSNRYAELRNRKPIL